MAELGIQVELAERLRDHLRRRLPSVRFAYLFGSVARGDSNPGSDLDLAIWSPGVIAPSLRFDVQEDLARLAGRDVDLVDLQSASTVLRVQVIGDGRLLIDDAPAERHLFEARSLSEYARLNEARAGILEDVARRGSIYGANTAS